MGAVYAQWKSKAVTISSEFISGCNGLTRPLTVTL
jgi:hypothetical protein